MPDTRVLTDSLKQNINKIECTPEMQTLIYDAVLNPNKLNEHAWVKLVESVTIKATQNLSHGRAAAKICNDIAQTEQRLAETTGKEKVFRKTLLNQLQSVYTRHKENQYRNVDTWVGFVNFLCSVFDVLQINNMPLMVLISPVYEVLNILTEERFIEKEIAIQCLVTQLQFIGEEIEKHNKAKMKDLVKQLNKMFLSDKTSQLSRLMLLEIIELQCGGWKLSRDAYAYYYEEVVKT
nr:MIF4G domain-containing protein-like [Ciona intestinalis]|eukprot:XP_004226070.2 MIF4G domain-containing protein-like [Ciona intestinalis]